MNNFQLYDDLNIGIVVLDLNLELKYYNKYFASNFEEENLVLNRNFLDSRLNQYTKYQLTDFQDFNKVNNHNVFTVDDDLFLEAKISKLDIEGTEYFLLSFYDVSDFKYKKQLLKDALQNSNFSVEVVKVSFESSLESA
ncbi:MAG: hypothetical protein MK033_08710, partial [Candidatus Caenarcaniphilales bacterium]|nr:hypothetical protein [Candidatus Caenarcaniphilales bacterium]